MTTSTFFIVFRDGEDEIHNAEYSSIVNEGFSDGGKLMLTPTNLAIIRAQAAEQSANDSTLVQ